MTSDGRPSGLSGTISSGACTLASQNGFETLKQLMNVPTDQLQRMLGLIEIELLRRADLQRRLGGG